MEAVARGHFDDIEPQEQARALASAWDQRITLAHYALQQAPTTGAVASPERWPGYQRIRVQIIHALLKALARRREDAWRPPARRVDVELTLTSPIAPLHGRIDRVEVTDDRVVIVDLKTSWRPGTEVSEDHRRQLLFYAGLWQQTHGRWPDAAAVQGPDGSRHTFAIIPEEAETTLAAAMVSLERYNRLQDPADLLAAAQPGPETCRFCDFRVICTPFFDTYATAWHWLRACLLGIVEAVVGTGDLRAVDVRCTRPRETDGQLVRVLRVPATRLPRPGVMIALADLGQTRTESHVEFTQHSVLAIWDGEGSATTTVACASPWEVPRGE